MTHCRILKQSLITKGRAIGGLLALALLVLVLPQAAHADVIDWLVAGIGKIFELLASLLGWLFVKITHALVNWVAPYNNFVGFEPTASGGDHPVEVGWVIVRDLSNMFFIVVLLVIAFGTMFRIEKYNYKQLLPRLLVMAVFINFSRTIVGLVIDAAQVAMLTFVNAFQAAAGGNIITGLGIQEAFNIPEQAGFAELGKALVSYMFIDIFLAVALVTVLIITVTLVARIVMLWVITILSPAAFLLSTFPKGQEYYSKWWDQLICWALSGPVLAFFLWLALATMVAAGGDVGNPNRAAPTGEARAIPGGSSIITAAAQESNIVRFIVGIMMLLIGVQMSQQFCAVGAGLALSLGKSAATRASKAAGKFVAQKGWQAATAIPSRLDYATGFRNKLYSSKWSPLRAVAPGFAQNRLAALHTKRAKAFEDTGKTAKQLAPDEQIKFANYAKGKRAITPLDDARQMGRLHTALSSPDVAIKLNKELGPQKANEKRREWMTDLKRRAERSGNPTMTQAVRDLERKNPLLIENKGDRIKGIQRMGGAAALELFPEQLEDPEVAANLSDKAKGFVRERGSKAQIDMLDQAETNPALIQDPTKRQTRVRALDPAAVTALDPKVQAQVFTDMDDAQRALVVSSLDIKSLTVDQLTAGGGKFAAELAKNPAQRDAIASDPKLARALQQGLGAYLKAPGAPLTMTDEDTLRTSMIIAGAPIANAFPGMKGFPAAVAGPDAGKILSRLTVGEFERDVQVKKIVTENIDINVDLAALATGGVDERTLAAHIGQAIIAQGAIPGADAAAATRKNDVESNPTLKALLGLP